MQIQDKSLEALQVVVRDQQVVHFVAGAFERLGVQVRDTDWLRFGLWCRRWRKQVPRPGTGQEAAHP